MYSSLLRFFSSAPKQKYGFIGLGQMGSRMAENLLTKSNGILTVYDINSQACDAIASKGAQKAATPREVAENSNIIITMLRSDDQVYDVYKNKEDSIIHGLQKNTILIDSSTINYSTARNISEYINSHDNTINYIDAPVSGGIVKAQAGNLTFMCGGDEKLITNKVKPILNYMGGKIVHCGDEVGSGQIAKVCNNLILAISMAAVAEGYNLGLELGLDIKKLNEVINSSTGKCWSSSEYNPVPNTQNNVPSSNKYNGGFETILMIKDLNLALKSAEDNNIYTPLGKEVLKLYSDIERNNYGKKDFSFIYQYIKEHDHLENLKKFS